MTDILWKPDQTRIEASQLYSYQQYLHTHYDLQLVNYDDLYQWSIDNRELFWQSIWDFFDIRSSKPSSSILTEGRTIPESRWFEGAKLNFAENLLKFRDNRTAVVSLLENGQRRSLTYEELYNQIEQLAATLKDAGVRPGDRIAGFIPNIPEALVAMLASTSLGAVWSSCSPDFGFQGVMDRFGQIEPKFLFAADGYFYNGKAFDSLEQLKGIADSIDSIEQVIVIPIVNKNPDISNINNALLYQQALHNDPPPLQFAQLPFNHPLYIVYSSGTTGKPKCIVHSAGGTLIQHLKELGLHTDIKREDVLFYYTTTGWMMWNWQVSGLALGCTLVLYDGSPFADEGLGLLNAFDNEGVTIAGVSARYLSSLEKEGIKPKESHNLASLKTLIAAGSPVSPESFDYVYRDIKQDICLSSISGGTDIISCFAIGNPCLPVFKGELQCRGLGMAVEFWNEEGNPLQGEPGELVCTRSFPSCPIYFWQDDDGSNFHNAYFTHYDYVWTHGDYGELTQNGGIIIHGRSDAVLNPGGVRIGTAEIYRQVEKLPEVSDSVVIGQQWQDDIRVVLFIICKAGVSADDSFCSTIRDTIRKNTSPRHVPAKIIQVKDIPRTISGKTAELAVRDIVHGRPVKNTDSLANPESLELFKNLKDLTS